MNAQFRFVMRNLDPILQVLLGDLLQLGQIVLAFSLFGAVPAFLISIGAGAANEQPSRFRDVASGAFWGMLAGVPAWVVTFLILLSGLQIAGALSSQDLVLALKVVSALAGVPAAYYASAWYFRQKAQQLWGWAIEYPPTPPQPANRWYSFSLKRLFAAQFVLIFVLALWVGARRDKIQRAYQQRRAMAELQAYQETLKTRFDGFGWEVRSYPRQRLYLDEQQPGALLINFDDKVLERIEPSDHLQRITIRSDSLTDAGLELLSRHPGIECLEIQSAQVTDAGVAHLTKLTQLKRVQLTCPQLTAKSLDDLQTMESLENVTLQKVTIPSIRRSEFETARPGVKIYIFP
jgi:hypothetical protein